MIETNHVAKNKPLTIDIVLDRLRIKNIELVEDFILTSTPTKFRCKYDSCGHEWVTKPRAIFAGTGCPKCANRLKLSNYNNTIYRLASKNIQLITEPPVFRNHKVDLKCLVCNHLWFARLGSVLGVNGCPKCGRSAQIKALTITEDVVIGRLAIKNIKLLDAYKGCLKYTRFKCMNVACGNEWVTKPSHIFEGSGCPKCAKAGFKVGKPSVIYVININGEYCGYGITNNTKRRMYEHKVNFLKNKMTFTIIAEFKCSGERAVEIENKLKHTYPISRCKVAGFRRESTDISNLDLVIQTIEAML